MYNKQQGSIVFDYFPLPKKKKKKNKKVPSVTQTQHKNYKIIASACSSISFTNKEQKKIKNKNIHYEP